MEQELVLERTCYPGGTNGVLYLNSSIQCYTIELPWLNNKPQHSCIPEGRYRLKKRYSIKHKVHLELEGVRGRSLILIHPANNALKELKGCIAPVTRITGEGRGTGSRAAFTKLMQQSLQLLEQGSLFINIKNNKR